MNRLFRLFFLKSASSQRALYSRCVVTWKRCARADDNDDDDERRRFTDNSQSQIAAQLLRMYVHIYKCTFACASIYSIDRSLSLSFSLSTSFVWELRLDIKRHLQPSTNQRLETKTPNSRDRKRDKALRE